MEIRPLRKSEVNAWRQVRLRMLSEHPESFGSDAEDFAALDRPQIHKLMRDGNVIGAFFEGKLVGAGGWKREGGRTRRHVARIWGLYVLPIARRRGVARAILRAAIDASRKAGVCVWQLGVVESNTNAEALYESEGFVRWGIRPDVFRFRDRSVDVVQMIKRS